MKPSLKIVWKTKITFLLSETLLFFLEQICFSLRDKTPKNLITIAFFFAEADTKNIDMPQQKPQMLHW